MKTESAKIDTDKVNEIFEKYKSHFIGSFHSFLWDILIKKIRTNDGTSALAYIPVGPDRIGLADLGDPGYLAVPFTFEDEKTVMPLDELRKKQQGIIEELNKDLFGLEPEKAYLILISSMSAAGIRPSGISN